MLTDTLDPLKELIKSYTRRKYCVASFVELYACLQQDLYTFAEMRKIARDLRDADKLIIELFCTLHPQLGVAFILESVIYEMDTNKPALINLASCLDNVVLRVYRAMCVNGHYISRGQYEPLILMLKMLGAMHASGPLVARLVEHVTCDASDASDASHTRHNHDSNELFRIAFNALRSFRPPRDLVAQYQSYIIWRPVPYTNKRKRYDFENY